MQKMLTIKDAQAIFGCGQNKIYQIIGAKGFPKIKIGKQYYIPETDLERWIEKNKGCEVII